MRTTGPARSASIFAVGRVARMKPFPNWNACQSHVGPQVYCGAVKLPHARVRSACDLAQLVYLGIIETGVYCVMLQLV